MQNTYRYLFCLDCVTYPIISDGILESHLQANAPASHHLDTETRELIFICVYVCPLLIKNFEEVNYAVCRRDPEKGKGSKLSGVSLDAPLAVIAQQGLFFIKFVLVVAAPQNVARLSNSDESSDESESG